MVKNILFLLGTVAILGAGCTSANVGVDSNLDLNSSIVESDVNDSSVGLETEVGISNETILNNLSIDYVNNSFDAKIGDVNINGSLNSEGVVVVESDDGHTGSAFVDADGSVVVNTDVDLSGISDVELSSWCVEGQVIEKQVDNSTTINFVISGIENFKNDSFCLSVGTVNAGGLEIPTSIYAKGPNSEFWVVTEIFGQVSEQKIIPNSN
jgi:hypothetical protein